MYFVAVFENAAALLMNGFLKERADGYEDDVELEEEYARVNLDGVDVLELWDVWACNLRLEMQSQG